MLFITYPEKKIRASVEGILKNPSLTIKEKIKTLRRMREMHPQHTDFFTGALFALQCLPQ